MIVNALSYWKIAPTFSVNSRENIDSRVEVLRTDWIGFLSPSPFLSSEVGLYEWWFINIYDDQVTVKYL
jgi:hypothetical protein